LNNAFQVGPLLLPFTLLLVFASVGLAFVAANAIAGRGGADADGEVWRALLVGILIARLAFVYEYRSLYLDSPLTVLDVRDGGWKAAWGLAAGWLYALYRQGRNRAVRKPLTVALGAGTALFIAGTIALDSLSVTKQPLPELTFRDIHGRTVQLRQFDGKPAVVNLWATWCPPCVRELPVLHQAQADNADVHFVFLNQGEDAIKVKNWLAARGLRLENVLIDVPRHASSAFQQKGYPSTLFFDASGMLASSRVGELSAATLSERLEQIRR
jgi:thiol-disulfide isomerase/thioredoxin